jgi:hypothetical protein
MSPKLETNATGKFIWNGEKGAEGRVRARLNVNAAALKFISFNLSWVGGGWGGEMGRFSFEVYLIKSYPEGGGER